MNHFDRTRRALLIIGLTVLMATEVEASSLSTYISLGDSIAYGTGTTEDGAPGSTTTTGFVSPFASAMAPTHGGTAPQVFNLALPGETTGTFFTGNANPSANSNYNGSTTTQANEFLQVVASQAAAGHPVNTVTIALGTQDIMNILHTPGFGSLSLTNQAASIQAGLSQIQAQYASVISEVRSILPNAQIDLIGAYNPFHATPNDPLAPIAEPAFLGLNQIIQNEAASMGATYINTYTAFLGHEGTYTNILGGTGDITPTAAGDSAITALLVPTIAPEPSTLFLAGLGLMGLAGQTWKRRKARVA